MNTILLSNICFLILLIQSSSIASLKTQTPKTSSFLQKQSTSIQISGTFNSTKQVREILSATIGESLEHKDTYYFIFLAKSLESFKKINQKFKSTLFDVFNSIIDLKYYQDKSKRQNSFVHVIIINGEVLIYEIKNNTLSEKPIERYDIEKGEKVIMAEWCENVYVDYWGNSFKEFQKKSK